MEQRLTAAHKLASKALGELALALAARRGVTLGRLRGWAEMLRQAANLLEGP